MGFSSMQGTRSSCILVIEENKLLGIFTERDVVKLTAMGRDFTGVKIADVMIQPVITLVETSFRDIFAALFLFRRYRIRHLVIVNEDT
ncbi:MAG: CBS domain-containing protein, partial [Dolichospermum sp.]